MCNVVKIVDRRNGTANWVLKQSGELVVNDKQIEKQQKDRPRLSRIFAEIEDEIWAVQHLAYSIIAC